MTVGKPPAFNSVQEMQEKIDSYFHKCENREVDFITKEGVKIKVKSPAPEHITGLCLHLKITNETLNQYQKKPEYSESILQAKKRCEAYAVNALFEGQRGNKADFVLVNNFKSDWKHSKDINHGGQPDNPLFPSRKEDEELLNELFKSNTGTKEPDTSGNLQN